MYIFDLSTQLLKYQPADWGIFGYLPPYDEAKNDRTALSFKREPVFLSNHGTIMGVISSVVFKCHLPPAEMPDTPHAQYVITYLPLKPECDDAGYREIEWDGQPGFMRETALQYVVNTNVMDVLTAMVTDHFCVVPRFTDTQGTKLSLVTVYGNDNSKYLVIYNNRPALVAKPILVGEYAKYLTLLLLGTRSAPELGYGITLDFDPMYLEYPTPTLYPVEGIVTLTDYEQDAITAAFTF